MGDDDKETWHVQLRSGQVVRFSLDELDAAYHAGFVDGRTPVLAPDSMVWASLAMVAGLEESVPPPATVISSVPPVRVASPPPAPSEIPAHLAMTSILTMPSLSPMTFETTQPSVAPAPSVRARSVGPLETSPPMTWPPPRSAARVGFATLGAFVGVLVLVAIRAAVGPIDLGRGVIQDDGATTAAMANPAVAAEVPSVAPTRGHVTDYVRTPARDTRSPRVHGTRPWRAPPSIQVPKPMPGAPFVASDPLDPLNGML